LCLKAGKIKLLAASAVMVVLIASSDWAVGRNVSLGPLYVLPMMLAAVVWRPYATATLAIVCAFLRSFFDTPASHDESILRFAFAFFAYFTSGLFITALVRNHELESEHLKKLGREQQLRRDAEEQLKVLVESSPAAILTVDGAG